MTTLRPVSTASDLDDERQALAAATADPLWLLARQWQTGGFIADDAGTPVHVELVHTAAPLRLDGVAVTGPIEPCVEPERPPTPTDLHGAERTRLAAELLRRVRDANVDDATLAALRAGLCHAYPLAPAVGPPQAPFVGRLPDAAALFADLAAVLAPDGGGDPFPALPGADHPDPATADAMQTAVRGWFAWAHPQIATNAGLGTPAADIAPATWDAEHLEYRFALTTELPVGELTLDAGPYDGSGVDWYSFNRSRLPTSDASADGDAIEVRPGPVQYAGMPRPRFWELEDGNVNLDVMAGEDPAHALLALFAHAYANDWFVVPLEVAPGASLVTSLKVTDTFGTVTEIAATAVLDGPHARWGMWELAADTAGRDPGAGDGAAGLRIHPPISPPPLEGPALEDLLVARDEMANLAWLIELTTRDADGTAVDRYRRWMRLGPAADPSFNRATQGQADSYRLGTPLPDHWYPLVNEPSSAGPRGLLLAEVPPGATAVSDDGVQGRLVPHRPETVLADEEASRTGLQLRRRDRLTRTPSGRVVWRARTREPGTREASSGLRFDVLR